MQVQWQQLFFRQVRHCQLLSIRPNDMRIRWGVPDGARDTQTGERVHDDLLISAALCCALEKIEWAAPTRSEVFIVPARDPLNTKNRF